MTILMHTLTRDGKRPEFRPECVSAKEGGKAGRNLNILNSPKEADTLLAKYRDGHAKDLLVLHNKSPQWNEGKISCYESLRSFRSGVNFSLGFHRNAIFCLEF